LAKDARCCLASVEPNGEPNAYFLRIRIRVSRADTRDREITDHPRQRHRLGKTLMRSLSTEKLVIAKVRVGPSITHGLFRYSILCFCASALPLQISLLASTLRELH